MRVLKMFVVYRSVRHSRAGIHIWKEMFIIYYSANAAAPAAVYFSWYI